MPKYEDFLKALVKSDWDITTLSDSISKKDTDKVVSIRHDVDDDIGKAKRMARLEMEMGVYSSYFLLVNHSYYSGGIYHANYISQLGHEVGIHIDMLDVVLVRNKNLHVYLMDKAQELRSIGIPVVGISQHGSPMAIEAGFKGWNYFYDYSDSDYTMIFDNQETGEERTLVMGVHPLKEYGLEYDAIKLDRKNYISDSHGELRINKDLNEAPNVLGDLYRFIDDGNGKTIMLLHPQWWEV